VRRAPVAHKTNRGCGWLRASLRWTSLRGIDGYLDAATSLGPICVSPAVPRHTGGVRPRNRRAAWCWRDGKSLHRRPSPANWRKVIRGLSGQLPATDQWATGADGIRDAGTHVVSMAGSCPKTQMVLGGFSQGAAVMGFVTSAAVPDGVDPATVPKPLQPEVAAHVAASCSLDCQTPAPWTSSASRQS
jgi:hypothetical protein